MTDESKETVITEKSVGSFLSDVRAEAKLTQRQLAEKLGKSPGWVAGIETGRIRVDISGFLAWSEACSAGVHLVARKPEPSSGITITRKTTLQSLLDDFRDLLLRYHNDGELMGLDSITVTTAYPPVREEAFLGEDGMLYVKRATEE